MVTLSLYRNLSHIFAIFGNILLPKVAKNGDFIDLKVAKMAIIGYKLLPKWQ